MRGPDTFVGRALAARNQWPPRGAEVDLDSVGGLLKSASQIAPLLALYTEEDDPTVSFIGRPVGYTARSIHLLGIGTQAKWRKKPDTWKFSNITRVEFGGRYEEALALVGGPPPG